MKRCIPLVMLLVACARVETAEDVGLPMGDTTMTMQCSEEGEACSDESPCCHGLSCAETCRSCVCPKLKDCQIGFCLDGDCAVFIAPDNTPCSFGICTSGICGPI